MRTVPPLRPNEITELEVKELAIRFTEALIKSWDFKVSVDVKKFAGWGLTIAQHLQDEYNKRLNDKPGT
jgi:hypothetical protein